MDSLPTPERATKSFRVVQPGRRIDVVAGYRTYNGHPQADVSVTEHASASAKEKGRLTFDKWWEYGFRWRVNASGPSIEATIALFEGIAAALRELRDQHDAKAPK